MFMNPLLVTFAILFVALGQSYAIKTKDNGIEILLAQVKDGISKIVSSSSSKTDKEKIQLLRKTGIAQIINLKGTSNSRVKFSGSGNETYLPVVQMHGMGDWAKDPFGMVPLAKSISEYLGGVYVLNVQIGENSIADILNGFIMNLDDQVDYFANVVKNDPNLVNGFNAVGYSQGNLLIRGYIERYNNPPVKNFISMHGPLAGVGAFPGCTLDHNFCRAFSEVLGALAYHPTVQDHLAQANYFRDPFRSDDFKAGAIFLPDINNEDTSVNQVYNTNWLSLESICLVKATGDTVVIPNDSEWFGFFQENSFDDIWSFKETPWYQGDLFGLQSLDKAGKVFFDTTSENHLDFDTDYLLNLVGTYFT